jgi:hypothetical protein
MIKSEPLLNTTAERLYRDRQFIAKSPGLANGGITLAVVEPKAVGWDQIARMIDDYGFIAFAAADKDAIMDALKARFGDDIELPFWESFFGVSTEVYATCYKRIAQSSNNKWVFESSHIPANSIIDEVMALNESVGVTPLPAWYMKSEGPPSLTSWIRGEYGQMVACANGSMRYHAKSRLEGVYYVGSVSVAPTHQGKGLGTSVTSLIIRDGIDEFGCKEIIGIAKAGNVPSQSMLVKCGLIHDPKRATVVLNKTGAFQTR